MVGCAVGAMFCAGCGCVLVLERNIVVGPRGRIGADWMLADAYDISGCSGAASCFCSIWDCFARMIPVRRFNIPCGLISIYSTPNVIIIAKINDI